MSRSPTIFLDLSRLLSRAGRENATGIDRVELAYARHYLGTGSEVVPVAVARGAVQAIDRTAAERYVARLEARWAGAGVERGTGQGVAPLEPRLEAFLAGAPATPYVPPAEPSRFVRLVRDVTARVEDPDAQAIRRRLAFGRVRPIAAAGPAVYLNVSHHHLDKPWLFPALGAAGPIRRVVYLHDVIPIDFPEYSRAGDAEKHWRRMRHVAGERTAGGGRTGGADLALVNSDHTAERVGDVLGRLGRTDLPITVAPLGLDLGPRRAGAATPGPAGAVPYFLCVSTIEARKNHLLLLTLWRRFVADHGAAAPRLVVVGRRGWEVETVIDMLERSEAIRGHVIEAGPVDDAALARLVAGARALLMPSFAEGFGLPVIEALAAGVPVIASDIPAHREVGGDVPEFLDPIDAIGWGRTIMAYAAADGVARRAQVERMRRWRPPDWASHFAAVDPALGL